MQEFIDLDTKSSEAIEQQIKTLKEIAADLIVFDSAGNASPKPGVTKEQMLYALEKIRYVTAIYKERIAAHQKLAKEIVEGQKLAAEVRGMAENIQNKYGGNVYPKWFMKMLGSK